MGKPPAGWPKDPARQRHGAVLISHPNFKPASGFFRTRKSRRFRGEWCGSNFAMRAK